VKYLLDTNICIYVIRNRPEHVAKRLKTVSVRHSVGLSSITAAELEYGVHKSTTPQKNAIALMKFLLPFEVIPFSEEAAPSYGKIRADLEVRGKPIGANDMLIAATALAGGFTLVTNNENEFNRIPGLKIENWVRGG
jgi:tRNA(fMet)-specific endonuclease VapC